jgi:glycosyltransferase involved in cell wall biosynthesis
MHDTADRTLLFHRDYRGLTGGHLKVRHYFSHAEHSTRYRPRIYFTPESFLGPENPWHGIAPPPLESWRPVEAAALFVAGLDWEAVPDPSPVPVINLIQHVRHAHPGDPRRPFLTRPAVRICVSEEVANALAATGAVNGPIHVIPNGIDLENIPSTAEKSIHVLIAGIKNPPFAAAVAARLAEAGVAAEVTDAMLPRQDFLDLLSRARVAITLPNREEGSYLPALEAMAAGATVVCPDCIGNRGFCRDRETAFVPRYTLEDVVAAAIAATTQSPRDAATMRAAAAAESLAHSLAAERLAFLKILEAL